MSKGRGGTSVNLGSKSRRRSTIILESSPSVEIASYDYEATLGEPEFKKSQVDDREVKTSPSNDLSFEKRETTPKYLGKEFTPKTVCLFTENQISGKLTTVTELAAEIPSEKKIAHQECVACKNIVNESGDEGVDVSDFATGIKESPNNPLISVESGVKNLKQVCSAGIEQRERNAPEIKSNLEEIAKRKIVNSSLLDRNKNSKIPRATRIISAAARVYQDAHIPSRGNSKTSLCKRSFFTTRSKTKKTSLRKREFSDAKRNPQPCEESPKNQVGSAGDHPSPLSTNLRLNNACRSCKDPRETVNLQLSIHDVQEPWSDSKSSPEIRSGNRWSRNRWSKTLKMNSYIESTSEEVDLSSEFSSDSMRPKTRRKFFAGKASAKSPIFKSGYTGNSPRLRARRRTRFSFLNTLFDIVFWPFLFLRTNR